MQEAQADFDAALQPLCPAELTAPKLHEVLAYDPIQPYIYGGKEVGSQGDGSVQFIARDEAAQTQVMSILETDLGLTCLRLTLAPVAQHVRPAVVVAPAACASPQPPSGVRKAIIPAAGFGTRMFPASRAMRKELFPVVSGDGWVKPAILVLIEEALVSWYRRDRTHCTARPRALISVDFYPLITHRARQVQRRANRLCPDLGGTQSTRHDAAPDLAGRL